MATSARVIQFSSKYSIGTLTFLMKFRITIKVAQLRLPEIIINSTGAAMLNETCDCIHVIILIL